MIACFLCNNDEAQDIAPKIPNFGIFAVDKVELLYVNQQLVENVKYSWSQHWRESHQMIFSDNHRLKKWFEYFIKFFLRLYNYPKLRPILSLKKNGDKITEPWSKAFLYVR